MESCILDITWFCNKTTHSESIVIFFKNILCKCNFASQKFLCHRFDRINEDPWRFNIRFLAHVLRSKSQSETIAFWLGARNCGNWRYNIYLLTLVLWHFCPIHLCLCQKRMKAWPPKEKKNPFHHTNLDYSSCYAVLSIIIDYKFSWNRKSSFLVS